MVVQSVKVQLEVVKDNGKKVRATIEPLGDTVIVLGNLTREEVMQIYPTAVKHVDIFKAFQ